MCNLHLLRSVCVVCVCERVRTSTCANTHMYLRTRVRVSVRTRVCVRVFTRVHVIRKKKDMPVDHTRA